MRVDTPVVGEVGQDKRSRDVIILPNLDKRCFRDLRVVPPVPPRTA